MSDLLRLQRAMADLLLEEKPDFREDPAAWATSKSLEAPHAASVQRYAKRLWVYRELVEFALTDPIENCFPISMALLQQDQAWNDCLRAFLAARAIPSPYYRDLNPAFLSWLAESGWGADRWPFLLSLAHWEYTELELLRMPEEPAVSPLTAQPQPHHSVVFREVRHLIYPFHVQDATVEAPLAPEGETHLLAWRDEEGDFQSLVLSPHASALVGRLLFGDDLQTTCSTLGLAYEEALRLIQTLQDRGVIHGFKQA